MSLQQKYNKWTWYYNQKIIESFIIEYLLKIIEFHLLIKKKNRLLIMI